MGWKPSLLPKQRLDAMPLGLALLGIYPTLNKNYQVGNLLPD
ncbi:hypothetical protein MC7420_3128 [Coleofasciculus chthonoplastes PCC 7420]|uniref:Uncharacterized protein n=1 Tax=Coleofasciculus chthonoplastes PCC 7420 TaxID=118168 RepID=B4VK14_9CYAN|nr:hypothetical protein MC7420_3128 [Coleofasciculus chthonoplastes PCC 7420]